jgi:hypothetical protein
LLVLLAALAPAAACTNFEEVSNVKDLRVLAVKTDPSEVILRFDPTTLSIDPASIPAIHVTPLLVDPPAEIEGRTVTWSLAACPNNPYGAAPPAGMGGGAPDPSGGARTTVGSTLCAPDAPNTWPLGAGVVAGGGLDVTFTPAQLIAAFMADIYVDQNLQPHGGFDLGMPMNLELTVTDGVDTALAIKRLLFWGAMLPGQVANHLPSKPAAVTYRNRDEKTWEPIGDVTPLEPATPVRVALGTKLWVLPQPPDSDVESYVTTVLDRDPPHMAMPVVIPRERLRYAFYATAGHFDPPRTTNEVPVGIEGTIHLESQYVPPATLDDVPAGADGDHVATMWIVVRDDRGGEDWTEAKIALEPAP